MDKNQFKHLVSHFGSTSDEEAEQLIALKKRFPYSQILHSLAARAAKDHNRPNHQSLLQMAAVYSTDRSVLKEIITAVPAPHTKPPATKTSPVPPVIVPSAKGTATDLADEVLHDLERLQQLKHNFESLFIDVNEHLLKPTESSATKPAVPTPSKPKSKLSKRERLIQLAKELEHKTGTEENSEMTDSVKPGDIEPLLNEIKQTRKPIKPENEKTKEQIELIDQFIKSQPTIKTPKIVEQENEDLASALKSGEFGDNVISETLAEILVRQGKKEKAIEVYKKLIWKFPQKKAYFAAQIEDLKK